MQDTNPSAPSTYDPEPPRALVEACLQIDSIAIDVNAPPAPKLAPLAPAQPRPGSEEFFASVAAMF
jgi:hypothetical protein